MSRQENIQKALDEFGANVVRLAKIELGARRKARRSNGKIYNKVIDNTGTLRNSLGYRSKANANSIELDILMQEYGEWVDKGREKGKGVPVSDIRRWVKTKPIRPRDPETGAFVKVTESRINSLVYLINRKIRRKGIEPTNFLTSPFNLKFKDLPDELVEAYALDAEDLIEFTINELNKKYKV